jgi:diacylglycerol kinase (ATP)
VRVGIIINPISGRRGRRAEAGSERESFARAWAARRGLDADVMVTASAGHASELARGFLARGGDRVVSWGGDGTANDVAGAVLESPNTVLGLVRAGSGDGLARGLGIPDVPENALDIAVGLSVRKIDVGWLAGRHFLNMAGVGFDAAIAHAFNRRAKRGLVGYISGGLTGVWTYRCADYALDLDGLVSTGPRFLIAFANGRQYGNGVVLAPDADPADGLLDAVLVDDGSPFRQLWRSRRLFLSPGKPAHGIMRLRVRAATISGTPLFCHVDGEPFESSGTIQARVVPHGISIAAPAGA